MKTLSITAHLGALLLLAASAAAHAAGADCNVAVGASQVDASRLTKVWSCASDPMGTHKAVCFTSKDKPDHVQYVRSKDNDEAASTLKSLSEIAERCKGS